MPVKAFSGAAGSSVLLLTLGFLNYHGDYKHFVSSQKALSENGLGSQAAGNLEHLLGRLKKSLPELLILVNSLVFYRS